MDALLRICSRGNSLCRFVLMHQSREGWKVFDYVDSGNNRYGIPQANLIRSGGRRLLVITSGGSGGTGVYTKYKSWYEVVGGRFVSVLDHVAEGCNYNLDPAREFFTRFIQYRIDGNRELLEVEYGVKFTNGFGTQDDFEHALWKDRWVVTYSRPRARKTFEYDARHSQVSKHFLEAVFDFDSLQESEVVTLFATRLLMI